MIFGPDLIGKVLSGEKIVTRRRSSRYQVGKVYAVQPGRGKKHLGHIEIVGVWTEPLRTVGAAEARLEGFGSVGDFLRDWRRLYGNWNPSDEVARIAFRLAPPCADCGESP